MNPWIHAFVPVAALLFWWSERRWPGRPYERMPKWGGSVLWFVLSSAVVATLTPVLLRHAGLHAGWFGSGEPWGLWSGYGVGLLSTSGANYGWHRWQHANAWLWRWTHQLHHSPVRVDIPGALYAHPLEIFLKVALGWAVNVGLLGLQEGVAVAVMTTLSLLSFFQHWNVRTPRALGLFLPRPEMHACHHERGVHARNFSELPLWDWAFGTYHNPQVFHARVGFSLDKATRIRDMCLGRDVHH